MDSGLSRRRRVDVRDGSSPFARWRQDDLHASDIAAQPEGAIFRLDRPECAHQPSGVGHSLWVSESLPGNVKPSGSIRFCDRPAGNFLSLFLALS